MTENEALKRMKMCIGVSPSENIISSFKLMSDALDELQQYRAIGTIEEIKDLKEKNNKDFELLLKSVKESYPMFKGAYVELDVFMGDVMRRFTRERK